MSNQEHEHSAYNEVPYSHGTIISVLSGSVAEGFAGISAAVMAVLGLANVMPFTMLFISTIVIGAALVFNGMATATRFSKLLAETQEEAGYHRIEIGSISAETLGGVAGIALGVLALVGVGEPVFLTSIAAIVYGTSIILGANANQRLNVIEISRNISPGSQNLARAMAGATSDIQMLVGLAAITLGVLALIGFTPVIMTLIAMLSIGVANLIAGAAISGRMFSAMHH